MTSGLNSAVGAHAQVLNGAQIGEALSSLGFTIGTPQKTSRHFYVENAFLQRPYSQLTDAEKADPADRFVRFRPPPTPHPPPPPFFSSPSTLPLIPSLWSCSQPLGSWPQRCCCEAVDNVEIALFHGRTCSLAMLRVVLEG